MATVLQRAASPAETGAPALPQPYLLFLGDTTERGYAKTAFGLADWASDRCVGEYSVAGCTVTTGLAQLTLVRPAPPVPRRWSSESPTRAG